MRENSWLVKIVTFPTCLDHAVQMSCSRNLGSLERVHLSDRQSDHASKQTGAWFGCGRMGDQDKVEEWVVVSDRW